MTPSKFNPLKQALLVGTGLLSTATALAAPMTFQQIPAGAGAREPAPNVIVTVDDSGSMGWDLAGCQTLDYDNTVYANTNDPARPATAPPCPTRLANTTPSRLVDLRTALRSTFGNPATGDAGIVADGRIRLAWQALDDRNTALRPVGQQNNQDVLIAGQINTLRPFTGQHRTHFDNFISSLRANSLVGTSLHKMMANVHGYMQTTGINGPYANNPGAVSSGADLSCRKTFHILMTDGAWNTQEVATAQAGNVDGNFGRTLPDGTVYNNNNQTRLYADAWGGPDGTIADWAKRHWSTDYQSLANDLRPLFRVNTNQLIGNSVSLTPYWNPRNNPMTWQGVTTYTIGFGQSASTWTGNPIWDVTTDNTFGGAFDSLVTGSVTWQDLMPAAAQNQRSMDLWHAALNGRGTFTPARSPTDLTNAFQGILNEILVQTTKPLVSIATNSSRLSSGGFTYVAGYNSEGWSGELSGYQINPTTSLPSKSPTWQATTLLDSTSTTVFSTATRVVLTHNGTQGTGFRWGNLSTVQQAALRGGTADTTTVGEQRVSYLLGDRSREQRFAGGFMRNRESRLGDIVNSNIWYTGKPSRLGFEHTGHASFRSSNASRTPVVYVGANDGMLHGFNANTGREVVAYVPKAAYEHLRSYTLPSYSHRFFVDGHPFTGDADLGGTLNWRTVLVSGLGAGGKGYFILDVTNPTNFVNPGAAASPIVLMDTTDGAHPDVGHIFSMPVVDEQTRSRSQQIVKMNNNRWAVVMGNGYNSTNERPVLLIQYLDGDRSLRTIVANATTGATNGLAAPQVIDVNGDGKVDIAYAGDLNGNLWKFNLTGAVDTSWSVGFSGSPLYTAVDAAGAPQAITVPPMYVAHPLGGIQLVFGTGRELTASDRSSTQVQTIYSIWDKSTYGSPTGPISSNDVERITGGRTLLVQQTQTGSVGSTELLTTSSNPVVYSRTDTTARRGWYFDLPVTGERVLGQPQVFEGQKALINSIVPKAAIFGESCNLEEAADRNFITILNAINGQPSKVPAFGTLDTSGSATRVEYGSGESITLTNQKNNETVVINTDYFCTGPSCAPCTGPACDVDDDDDDECGGFSTGVLEICRAGLLGTRTDWRELR